MPANAFEANATNPLGMDPMLLATAFYASLAMESESAYDGETSEHTLLLVPTVSRQQLVTAKPTPSQLVAADTWCQLHWC